MSGPYPYYQDEHVTLYCGDCREVLPTLPKRSAGMLIADPPYGMNWRSGRFGFIQGDDGLLDVTQALSVALSVIQHSAHLYVFQRGGMDAGNVQWGSLNVSAPAELIWEKGSSLGVGNTASPWSVNHEKIIFAIRVQPVGKGTGKGTGVARQRRGSVLRHQRPVGAAVSRHPTEKPVSLLRELIEMSSKPGDVVLDPFAGVGSTLVAAVIEGRKAVGIELDENYCRIAVERLRAIQPHLNGLRGA